MQTRNEKYGAFDHLIGEKLSAVTFVWEYYQLQIGTTTLSIYSHPEVHVGHKRFAHGAQGYRDALCERIGSEVADVIDTDQELIINLKGDAKLLVSLLPKDRVAGGPESVVATNPQGNMIVIGDS